VNPLLKRLLWWAAATAAILAITAVLVCITTANRARLEWEQTQQNLRARGESLNWGDYLPQPVPDDQNFFEAPIAAEWFTHTHGSDITVANLRTNPATSSANISKAAASNYLAWSEQFAPQFARIQAALKRPAARINGDYTTFTNSLLPNFTNYRIVGEVLLHKAKCHLVLGEADQALADLTLHFELSRTLAPEDRPTSLIAGFMYTLLARQWASAIGDGLQAHLWSEPKLVALQKQLADIHLLSLNAYTLKANRASDFQRMDRLENKMASTHHMSLTAIGFLRWTMRGAWIDHNNALLVDLEGRTIMAIDMTNQTVSPSRAKAAVAKIGAMKKHANTWSLFAAVATASFGSGMEGLASDQTKVDQAQIVCALERYRLHNRQYPPTLATLVPQFIDKIPNDVITGKPMIYVRKGNDNFLLYSVGWNEVDDGGLTAHNGDGSEDRDRGDWVWHYPEP
jgi:hypothetical protein